ncbi:dna topoisomerase i [Emericellopsis cladophorae]|uniref:DNA topoisomerase I n=1 Tax=Emericellopsis cladophorae TaxID=2686198 RepID=A0A9Q0BB93_9HYPO|nr:dna topoisomerase i [Emericellopsis cladophorae]KAI6779582.1 dna topoisomerase i [Emericellopsis cladophorae]
MSSAYSDDDQPLAKSNGHLSNEKISPAEDARLDKSLPNDKPMAPGISIRNGPVEDAMDVDEPMTNGHKRKSRSSISKPLYKDESGSEDDQPLAKRTKTNGNNNAASDSDDAPLKSKKMPPSYKETALPDTSSDDDTPLNVKLSKKKSAIEKAAAKEAQQIRAKDSKTKAKKVVKDESDDDDRPIAKSRPSNGAASQAKRKPNGVKKEESDSDAPIKKTKAAPKKAKATTAPNKKVKAKTETPDVEDEEKFAWWNAESMGDGSIKWHTLEHNGVIFPPEYEPMPKHVKMRYDGEPIDLSIEAEEVASFWVHLIITNSVDNLNKPQFRENFFNDFKEYVKKYGATNKDGKKVAFTSLEKCDFQPMVDYLGPLHEARKNKSKEEKAAIKKAKDEAEAPYLYCIWDGRKELLGNPRVEPPGLFRGRGEHPKTGKVKTRVSPEQVTINIGKDAKVPTPPAGHKWGKVVHEQGATWVAMWKENINGAHKYVMLAANSAIKGMSDMKKFEKARELKKHIDKIRKDYTKDLKSELSADRQRATAMYFIDKLALRAGNEKDAENEAETVGCCSLKFEHITLTPPNKVTFDFLGKDSIRYHETSEVDPQIFKNLKIFKKPPKGEGDDIFDRLSTTQLNKHLTSYMPGLTAKVFRTYNASYTMSQELKKLDKDPRARGTIAEKVKLYNDANREVAILCNHKRSVGAAHESQMAKLGDKIKGIKYQNWRMKKMILDVDKTQRKKLGTAFFERDEDLTDEWIKEHQEWLVEQERIKITKKFEKENEKRKADKEKAHPEKELKERLRALKDLEAKFKKENKDNKVEAEGRSPTVEKFIASIEKNEERIKTIELQAADRDGNKEVALGTSKINYIDPRLSVVFCKKFDVPIEKIFSKTLRDKFNWAIQTVEDNEDWEF